MATGKEHAKASRKLAPVVGVATAVFTGSVIGGVAAAAGCLAGIVLSPDLDIEGITISERKVLQSSRLLGGVWMAIWYPYAVLIPHRSPLSHWPVLGTVLRLLYLYGVAWLATAVYPPLGEWVQWLATGRYLLPFTIGLAASDVAHWWMDYSIWFDPKVRNLWRFIREWL